MLRSTVLLVVLGVLTGCGSKSPQATYERFVDAVRREDADAAVACLSRSYLSRHAQRLEHTVTPQMRLGLAQVLGRADSEAVRWTGADVMRLVIQNRRKLAQAGVDFHLDEMAGGGVLSDIDYGPNRASASLTLGGQRWVLDFVLEGSDWKLHGVRRPDQPADWT